MRWPWLKWLFQLRRRGGAAETDAAPRWNERGIELRVGGEAIEIGWPEIRKVFAYKKDCYTCDQLRLVFVSDLGMAEFTEDAENFFDLVTVAGKEFGIGEGWLVELLGIPSFDETWRLMYMNEKRTGELR